MTQEDLKKYVRPLVWVGEDKTNAFMAINCIDTRAFIFPNDDGTWYSYADDQNYPTREEAERSIEEYHLTELSKFFDLDEED